MKTIALIAQKGGTGKTIIAAALAVAAHRAGLFTAVIDLDPQASACNWRDRRVRTRPEDSEPAVSDAQAARLPQALERARADLIVIDTPARSEQAALAAAQAADLVIIPCRPQALDLETVPNSLTILKLAGKTTACAVLNAVPSRGARQDQASAALRKQGLNVLPVMLGARAAYGDAMALGQSAQEFEPSGRAAAELAALWDAVAKACKLTGSRKFGKMKRPKDILTDSRESGTASAA
jgi:chromosome partitioning protein